MALESFLLHFRNLRAFLCPTLQQVWRDDLVASDYLGKLDAEDVGNPVILGRRKKKLDRLLAHLSYSRIDYARRGGKSWPVSQMLSDMGGELKQFLSLLPPKRRGWFLRNQVVALYLA